MTTRPLHYVLRTESFRAISTTVKDDATESNDYVSSDSPPICSHHNIHHFSNITIVIAALKNVLSKAYTHA